MDIPITVHKDPDNEDENKGNEPNEQTKQDPPKSSAQQNNDNNNKNAEEHDKKSMGKTGVIAIIAIVIMLGVFFILRSQNSQDLAFDEEPIDSSETEEQTNPQISDTAMQMKDSTPVPDSKIINVQNDWIANISTIDFKNSGLLTDVSGGNSSGVAGSDLVDGIYHLYSTFQNLPALEVGFFYEGWIVKKDPLSIKSTGALVDFSGEMVNAYLSRENLIDHTTYVLTLEPDDGDPSPAKHILEGEITPKL